MKVSTLLMPVLLLAGQALAKHSHKINCKNDSRHCKHGELGPPGAGAMKSKNPKLRDLIEAAEYQLNDTKVYPNERFAACVASSGYEDWGLCAYPMYTEDGITGKKIKELLQLLDDYHCDRCGHVSDHGTYLNLGQLTVNTATNIKWKPVKPMIMDDLPADFNQDKGMRGHRG